MALAIPIETFIYISLIVSVIALISSLYAASSASRVSRETKALALKWELESIKPIEPQPTQQQEKEQPPHEPIIREASEEEMIEREEPPKEKEITFSNAEELRSGLELEAIVLFDSLGQVIDYAGSDDARQVAALMAELAGLAGLSSGDSRFIFVGGAKRELIARVTTMNSKVLYLYARGVNDPSEEMIERIINHAKKYLGELTSPG